MTGLTTNPDFREQPLLGRMLPLQMLAELLQGIGRNAFFQAGSDSRAVHVPGDRQRFRCLFDPHGFQLAASHAKQLHALFSDADGWMVDVSITEDQVARMIAAGVAVCAGSIRMKGALDEFLQACRLAAPSRPEFSCNAFLSPRGSAFALHMDPKPTLILQLAGQRRWRFTPVPEPLPVELGIALPPNADRVHLPWGVLHRPDPKAMVSLVLNAGEALYLPAGCWHEGYSISESFALSITTASLSPLAAMGKAIAEGVAGARTCMPPDACDCGEPGPDSSSGIKDLQMITPGLSLLDVRNAWDVLAEQQAQTVESCN